MGECKVCGGKSGWFCDSCGGVFYCKNHMCRHFLEQEAKKALDAQKRKPNATPENVFEHMQSIGMPIWKKEEDPEKKRQAILIGVGTGILAALGMLVLGTATEIKEGIWSIVLVGLVAGAIAYAIAAPANDPGT